MVLAPPLGAMRTQTHHRQRRSTCHLEAGSGGHTVTTQPGQDYRRSRESTAMSETSNPPQVTITTDGAARSNPGPGGWAALLEVQRGEHTIEKLIAGEEPSITTNNAMELQGVIGGLSALKKPCQVTLRMDSTYVMQGIERILAGAILSPKMKNYDRWVQLEAALHPHRVTCEWVRGHNGDPRNERVDEAANRAAERAYELAEAQRKTQQVGSHDQVWTLVICSPGTSRPVQWVLRTPITRRTGEIHVTGITEPTAVWEGLIQGLMAAQALAAAQPIVVDVITNYDLIVKQGRGEWKVKNPAQQPLAAQLSMLRQAFSEVRFEFIKTEGIRRFFKDTE